MNNLVYKVDASTPALRILSEILDFGVIMLLGKAADSQRMD